jgi:hypothetical protein
MILEQLFHVGIMLAVVGVPYISIQIIIEKIKEHNAR